MSKKFFDPEDGRSALNVDQIKSIQHRGGYREGEKRETVITFVDDVKERVSGWIELAPLYENRTAIPATDGYTLVGYWKNDKEEYIEKFPIIAWSIDPFGKEWATLPVTVDGIPNGNTWAVLQPDGLVICPGIGTWPDYKSWLKEMRRKAAEREAAAE